MKKVLLPFSIVFVFCFAKCNKDKNEFKADNPYGLPNATQIGANIFACRINGQNWVLKKVNSYNLGTSFSSANNRDTLSFFASGAPDTVLNLIAFTIKSRIQQGNTYHFNDTTKAIAITFRTLAPCGPTSGYGGSQWNYATDGYITFTKFSGTYTVPSCCSHGEYDKNAIIAGNFNFIIAIPNCDTIKVSDGRFDINYSQY